MLELPKARHNLIENQGKKEVSCWSCQKLTTSENKETKRGILLELPKALTSENKEINIVGATKSKATLENKEHKDNISE